MALFLILFIIIFGVWANLYIFEMMTWQVLLSGMGLPWIGFSFGFVLAKLLKRPMEDIIAIAIETGIQNTGMSIFILWLTLDHPLGDMAGKLTTTHFNCRMYEGTIPVLRQQRDCVGGVRKSPKYMLI